MPIWRYAWPLARGGVTTLGRTFQSTGPSLAGIRFNSTGGEVLTATAVSDVARLGGAIAARIRQDGETSVRCIGAKAAFQFVKALVNAMGYLSHDPDAPPERFLGFQVREGKGEASERGRELRLRVLPLHVAPSELKASPNTAAAGPDVAATDLLVGNGTVPAKAAAAMAGALRPQGGGHGKYPLVRAMGSTAVHRAMVSGMLAQKFLDNDDRGVTFCIVPYWSVELSSEQNNKQLILRLIHLPKAK
ncbi:unnamed protein product [Durusdinium trenchii]|uniref:Uncharacterized protein n=1 Tax=Durusdinium trenchii TaxID=1381693 RepID=A0ABP0LDD9_9DINO